jgi:capsular exopolysaccharide synthesis family protein
MDKVGLDFQDVSSTIQRRKFQILLAAGVGAALAATISNGLPVHYTSEALLEVEAHSALMTEMNPGAPATTSDQVRTEADILQSRALAESVVRELKLADAPDFKAAVRSPTWIDQIVNGAQSLLSLVQQSPAAPTAGNAENEAVQLFEHRLRVVESEKSHIVAVRFQSGSPQLSADVVNTLLTRYLSNQVASNLSISSQENQWLSEHMAALQRDVDAAAAKAQAFRDASELVDIQAGSLPAVQLNEKLQALSAARQALSKAQSAYDTAMKQGVSGSAFAGQEALASQLIERLREHESDVLQRVANIKQRGGENSPYLPPVIAELNSVRQQIAGENAKIVSALGREVVLARDRVNNLQGVVADSQAQARHAVASAATLTQLNQDVEAKRHVYNAFLTRTEQTQLASTKFPTERVVSAAAPPFKPDGMPTSLVAVLGALASTFITIAVLLIRQVLKGKILTAKDLEFLTGLAPIGTLPALPGANGLPIPLRILDMAQSGTVETLHGIRYAIQTMKPNASCVRVLITSSLQEEGKTTLAASLARLSASAGVRVLLVEGDLRRPTLNKALRLSAKHSSIETVLTEGMSLADAVQIEPKSGLHCLTATGTSVDVVTTLQSQRFADLMSAAETNYDMVIIDSPPVLNVIDALILAKYSDVILFAVAAGRASAVKIGGALQRFPTDVQSRIATVLTRVPQSESAWQGQYSGYQRRLASAA